MCISSPEHLTAAFKPHSKDALLGWDLVTVGAILVVNSTSCSRNQFEMIQAL